MFDDETKVTDYRSLYKRKEELKNEAVRSELKIREKLRLLATSDTALRLFAGPAVSTNPFIQMISGGLRSLAFRLFGMSKQPGFFKTLLFSLSDRFLLMFSPKIKEELESLIDTLKSKLSSTDEPESSTDYPEDDDEQDTTAD